MAKRKPIKNRKKDKRIFSKLAVKQHPKNNMRVMRGGIRM